MEDAEEVRDKGGMPRTTSVGFCLRIDKVSSHRLDRTYFHPRFAHAITSRLRLLFGCWDASNLIVGVVRVGS